ncbi:lantibiotic dehydratase [Microbispora sp. KK1-11]|uniref:lantibiotic dehydratase n=1 Tax=Microbispora sp. KK1-11 TaxID=2053005 RepID=UPI0011576BB9|nr:lantibiotic dehydratase [Microbispora sp. KK1-11]TQS25188.1 lantibiotic dehydratase [Microbispora sp. KK1-11]
MAHEFGMLRVALLSVEESGALVAGGGPDPLATMAVDLAWGSPGTGTSDPAHRPRDTTLRYITRMGGRATPYGLFAGTAHVPIRPERKLEIAGKDRHSVQVRLDFEVLQRIVLEAMMAAGLEGWPVRRNRTLRRNAGGLRYTKSGDSTSDVVTLRATPAIEAVLGAVGDKSVRAGELLDGLESHFAGSSREALRDFVGKLIDGDVLHRAVDLIRPGDEPAALALSVLEGIGDQHAADVLTGLVDETCGARPLGTALIGRINAAWERAAERMPALRDFPQNRRFHLDLDIATHDAALDQATVTDLIDTVRRLQLVFPDNEYLPMFRAAFRRRYEDTEVPLLDALDLENGVLWSAERELSPLAESARIRRPHGHSGSEVPVEVYKVLDRWINGERVVDLADLPMAPTCSARGLLAALLDDFEGRYHSMLRAGYQRSSMALISRFALGREDRTADLLAWAGPSSDDQDGPIHAELVYSPGIRISNVLIRPKLLEDEIALSGAGSGSLSLDRLLVRLEGDAVRLRDSVTGRDVIVEMNAAHNVAASGMDPVYSFLGMLVSPGAIGWSWGALQRLSHLPRVTCGKVVVSPETWTVSGVDLSRALTASRPGDHLRRLLDGFGERRWVGVGDDDRVLAVDLDSADSVRACLTRYAHEAKVALTEMPHVESPASHGPAGRHVTELVVPLQPTAPSPGSVREPAPYDPQAGMSWVYFKYYCGSSAADAVIAESHALALRLRQAGAATDWFFVRYYEEGFHVRVRVRPAGAQHRAAVIAALDGLAAALRERGLVVRSVMDDYIPEVTRYGGASCLPAAEALFTADSDAVATYTASAPDEHTRLYQCVADMLFWSETLLGDDGTAHEFLRWRQSGLVLSFERSGNPQGVFFRDHRARLDAHLATAVFDPILRERLAAFGGALTKAAPERSALFAVANSTLHMHCNRLLAVDSRRLEFLACELAMRKLREYLARGRKGERR